MNSGGSLNIKLATCEGRANNTLLQVGSAVPSRTEEDLQADRGADMTGLWPVPPKLSPLPTISHHLLPSSLIKKAHWPSKRPTPLKLAWIL